MRGDRQFLYTALAACAIGVLGGFCACALLSLFPSIARVQQAVPWLWCLLPLAAMLIAILYRAIGKGCAHGDNLLVESFHSGICVPLQLLALIFCATVLTHLCGGSAGRTGACMQMGGAVAYAVARRLPVDEGRRRTLLLAGVSAGFTSALGTPFAGVLFGMELCYSGRVEVSAAWPCALSAACAHALTRLCGLSYATQPALPLAFSWPLLLWLPVLAGAFGLCGRWFAYWIPFVKAVYTRLFAPPLLRALAAGAVLVALLGLWPSLRAYTGLSSWMQPAGLLGQTHLADALYKFLLTGLTLGGGLMGGAIAPLFAIGASLGGALAVLLGLDPAIVGALGWVCVFAAATNAPLCALALCVELFGFALAPFAVPAIAISTLLSGHAGLYGAQVIAYAKRRDLRTQRGWNLAQAMAHRRTTCRFLPHVHKRETGRK